MSAQTKAFLFGLCGGGGALLIAYDLGRPLVALGGVMIIGCIVGCAWLDSEEKRDG